MTINLSSEALARVEELKNYYPQKKSAVMPILQLLQEEFGKITDEGIDWVAEQVGMSPVHVRELVTFYSMYTMKQRGDYHFQVCRTLSCAVMGEGSKKICEAIEKRCGIREKEVSKNGLWSYEQVECLGSCGTGPMCEINDRYFENLTSEKIVEIIDLIEKEKPDLKFSTKTDSLGEGLKNFPPSLVYVKE